MTTPRPRLVGNGGCTLRLGVAWNLGYRLVRSAWGHGYAQEIIAAGRAAAAVRRPDLPVTAYLLEHNVGSHRSVERAGGFTLVRRGPDAGNPDPDAVRLLYADRPLDTETLEVLTAALWPPARPPPTRRLGAPPTEMRGTSACRPGRTHLRG